MKIAVLTGGVGGAKFVHGLVMSDVALTAIVNTGDDFRHLGLAISPDIDSVLYALSGKDNRIQGWGRAEESWAFMAALRELGGPDWFNLGDGDLALHVVRSNALAQGAALSEITADFARAWNVRATILPMSDDPVATWIDTIDGPLAFQRYFVEQHCKPVAKAIRFEGAQGARAAPGVIGAILGADAVLIAPSNPYLSVDPILAVAEIRSALVETDAPVIAISPIVGGAAVKGPTAKLMGELGIAVTNASIAAHYEGLIDAMLHDESDAPPAIPARATQTLMATNVDRARVAQEAIALAQSL